MADQLSKRQIGSRVRAVREAAKWSQDVLAQQMNFNDRQTVSDIETGNRSVKPAELMRLADLFGRDVEFFIEPFAVVGEAQFSWRADPSISQEALDSFELRAGRWVGMLRWLREEKGLHSSALKPVLKISATSSYEDAQECAERLVADLLLGDIPADRLADSIEKMLRIPILYVDTIEEKGKTVSGATCHLDEADVILINRNENEARRNYDLAHELFHAMTWEWMRPDHRESNSVDDRKQVKRTEELADNFASALLMPKAALDALIVAEKADDAYHLFDVACQLKVSGTALAWRLTNLNRITMQARKYLLKIKHQYPGAVKPNRYSESFARMLHERLSDGSISARKAAKTMGVGIGELLDLFAEYKLSAPFDL